MPAYLVPVPMSLSLEAPIPRDCGRAFELQEAIEQRASARRHPRRRADRARPHGPPRAARAAGRASATTGIVVAAGTAHTDGLSAADVAWLLEHAAGEVVVVRPADEAALAAA